MDTKYTLQIFHTSDTAHCLRYSYSVLNYGRGDQIPRAVAQQPEFSFDSLSVSRTWTVSSRKYFVHKFYSVFSYHQQREAKLGI